jgi:hypothetical protein
VPPGDDYHAQTFDATFKDLAQINPGGFLAAFDAAPTRPVQLLNVDLSTVTTSADVVFGLGGTPPKEIVHINAQASASADEHLDILVYNSLLHRQYRVPVHSILLLLRPQARHSNQTGKVVYAARADRGKMDFGYEIIPLWERPVEAFLGGVLGALPLAPLCRLPEGLTLEEGLRQVLSQVAERLQREAPQEQAWRLLTAAVVLTGLRVSRAQAGSIFQGVKAMTESETLELFLDMWRIEEAHRLLLLQGRKRFGEPDEASRQALTEVRDLDRLHRLAERLLDVSSWQELLQTP